MCYKNLVNLQRLAKIAESGPNFIGSIQQKILPTLDMFCKINQAIEEAALINEPQFSQDRTTIMRETECLVSYCKYVELSGKPELVFSRSLI